MDTLADYLNEPGRTDGALAQKVRCSRSMISKIKNKVAEPSLGLAIRIHRETGVPIESMCLDKGEMGDAAADDTGELSPEFVEAAE